jgi:hypothetical protein
MNPEERLDRLETLARFFVVAERRHRKNIREQDEKIDILIKMQLQSEDRFNARFVRIEAGFAKNEERFDRMQQAIDRLVAAQARTEDKLQALIDTLRRTNLGGLFA